MQTLKTYDASDVYPGEYYQPSVPVYKKVDVDSVIQELKDENDKLRARLKKQL